MRQLADIPNGIREKIDDFVFNQLISVSSIAEIGKIEKMQVYDGFYKVRFGDYRLGLVIQNGIVTVKTVMHRKEIYRFFP